MRPPAALPAALLTGLLAATSAVTMTVPAQATATPTPTPTPTAAPTPTADAERVVAAFGQQSLTWRRCGRQLRCSSVRVPLDYSDPAGAGIRLAISRPAGPMRQRAMVFNPGGPGGSAADIRQYLGYFPPALQRRYTPIGFDPRGVAASGNLVCYTDRQLRKLVANPPRGAAAKDALFARWARIARACSHRYPDWLGNMTTPDSARDLEVIRHALRQPRLHYLGVSYGTYLGATYAAAFPDRVGRMILDSGLSPTADMRDWLRAQSRATQQVFRVFARDCAGAPADVCPWRGSTDDVITGYNALLRQLERHPAQPPGFPDPVTATSLAISTQGLLAQGQTGESLLILYLQALHPPAARPPAPQLRATAARSRALVRKVRRITQVPANLQTVNQAVNCSDRPTADSPRTATRDARRWASFAPSFGRYFAWRPIGCAAWPVRNGDAVLPRPVSTTRRPILLLAGTRDPLTPIQWTYQLARGFSRARVLTWTGMGHGVLGFGSDCVQRSVTGYVRTGRLPHHGRVCA
ncbi:MAG: alpha/beta hydrolase [Candidatus Nanopelagicales bacterium]